MGCSCTYPHALEQFGEFKLKSGIMSPVYFDLRVTVSYPKILKQISDQLWEISKDGTFDVMCGLCTLPVSARARLSVDMRSKHACPYPPSQRILLCTSSGDSLKYCKLPEPIEIRPGPVHLGHRCELYAFPPMKSESMCCAGVPYTALPFATAMSVSSGRPMIMRRKV